ncbi:glycoside hydrolase/deacetylase [Microstroma glucosiphilum]|uniref:chitin deacetylase n=1 Tax=Pseudomicrostroma glucosiphilum TaxID=1684307 RepID=A0A316UC79_9BASI|nr:glycoside hydrolase/deacetylase [Pseudomicrostroma glucosiphilum]PWN22779.1 glycoside hydrolase/deacetylase [Pseudomicrostroma glucosiphilum]
MVHFTSLAAVAAAAVLASSPLVSASAHQHIKRQATATSKLPASLSSAIKDITSGVPKHTPTYTLSTTYSAGATNTFISGAPALPATTALTIADFPTLDVVPPTNSSQAKAWLAQYDLSGVPDIPVTTDSASCSSNAENLADAAKNHWWTCGGYTTDTDITVCPDENTWGVSYDDGPSPYTPKLLKALEDNGDLKATFFVVGSRVLSRPEMLQYEYMQGHQISVHTWSHPALTTLSNEEILLELAWTKEVIRQTIGVTPNTMRPPYGDIDDRVRAICKLLDLTPIIWTSTSDGSNFDTNDWQIQGGAVSTEEVVETFETILEKVPTLDTGYIVLQHDLYEQSTELAVDVVLPIALSMQPTQSLMPIITCLKQDLGNAYIETNANTSESEPYATGTSSVASQTRTSTAGGSTGTSGGSSSSSDTTSTSGAMTLAVAGPVAALAGLVSFGMALLA